MTEGKTEDIFLTVSIKYLESLRKEIPDFEGVEWKEKSLVKFGIDGGKLLGWNDCLNFLLISNTSIDRHTV